MKRIVVKITEHQLIKLDELYRDNFVQGSHKKKDIGVIIGHPDLNSMKIEFHAFKYHEYLILKAAVTLIKWLRGDFKKRTDNKDPQGMYSLWQAKVE